MSEKNQFFLKKFVLLPNNILFRDHHEIAE
jgi:hypothetical protein